MPERLKYHFEPRSGWMNDPNGLVFYGGLYHAFFQHNPFSPRWDRMHWGHAVSRDLIHWEQLPIALSPDQPYEDDGGCFSGSAIEKDGALHLMYTSVSRSMGQTQSVAVSRDGVHFDKYPGNPVLRGAPDGSPDFRDPKVFRFGDEYRAVVGSGHDGAGRVLLYRSRDLRTFSYMGVLFEDASLGRVFECPDFFPLDGKYVLLFSRIDCVEHAVQFIVGSFDGEVFVEESRSAPEVGSEFYAPQTFLAPDGRRIMIGWLYSWKKELDAGADYAGALTIPRELFLRDGAVCNLPVREAAGIVAGESPRVRRIDGGIAVAGRRFAVPALRNLAIVEDTKTVEVFANGGSWSCSVWFGA